MANDRHYTELTITLEEEKQILGGNKQLAADIINKYSLVGIYKDVNNGSYYNDKINLLERYYVKPDDFEITDFGQISISIMSSNGKREHYSMFFEFHSDNTIINCTNVVVGKNRIASFNIIEESYYMGHELLYNYHGDSDSVDYLVWKIMKVEPEKRAEEFLDCFGIDIHKGYRNDTDSYTVNDVTLDLQFARGNVTDPTQAKDDFFSGVLGNYTVKITMNVYAPNRASGELLDTVYYELPLKIIPPEYTYVSYSLLSQSGDWLCSTWDRVYQGELLTLQQTFNQEDGVPEGYQVVGWSTTPNGPIEFPVGSTISFEQAYYSKGLYAVLAPISTQPVVSPTTPVVQHPTQVAPQPTTVQTSASSNVLVAVLVITIATCGLIVVRRNK